MRGFSRGLAVLLTLLSSSCQQASQAPGANQAAAVAAPESAPLATISLRIMTAAGPVRTLSVEVAVTPEEQQHGLMGREALAAGHGMLFPFALPRTASFWMKDTPLALDLLFVRPDGSIAAILPGTPEDLHPISAGEPVSAVIEIAGGSARALGIAAGDHVQWGQCPGKASRPGEAWDALSFCPPAQ